MPVIVEAGSVESRNLLLAEWSRPYLPIVRDGREDSKKRHRLCASIKSSERDPSQHRAIGTCARSIDHAPIDGAG